MTRKPYIESSISALQNRGGYLRVSILDNPLDKIFRALSWLLAAASAFVCAVGGSALGVVVEYPLPLHFTLYTLHQNIHPTLYPLPAPYLHWNLIGTSLESDWNLTERSPRDHREMIKRN